MIAQQLLKLEKLSVAQPWKAWIGENAFDALKSQI